MVVKRKRPKPLLFILIVGMAVILILTGSWLYFISPVNSNSKAKIEVVIPQGTSTPKIAKILKDKDLIKSEFLFNIYVKLNRGKTLKASTYTLQKSMSLQDIIAALEKGNTYNPDVVKITFKEGKRITDYCETIAEKTNHTYEEAIAVMKDQAYITSLIKKYWFLTEEILDSNIYYPLEGYLAPDTYHFKNKEVEITEIIEALLDETEQKLEKYKEQLEPKIHEYMTMASIVELEGTNTENRKMIVGVFNNRLAAKMNLGSDVTTYYALQYPMTSDLTTEQFATNNAYNTRAISMRGKLPIGPICNPSLSSIEASLAPQDNDYLYFVADKNGKIYYTKTLQEHEKQVQEIKDRGDWIW